MSCCRKSVAMTVSPTFTSGCSPPATPVNTIPTPPPASPSAGHFLASSNTDTPFTGFSIADPDSNPNDVTVVWSDRGTPNPNATPGCFDSAPGDAPNYDPCNAGPSSNTDVYYSESFDGGTTWTGRQVFDASPGHQWFPWAGHKSDGSLVVAWDEDVQAAGGVHPTNDQFVHVLRTSSGKQVLGSQEQLDISLTHWAGQYVPQSAWPTVCGPDGVGDPAFDAPGKDCNEFHGDYTGLAVDSLDRVHVTWTGLNRRETSTQVDPYTGGFHDGYVQDAMYALR